ncbi:FAD-dependent oxidoreductase [Sneathiella limimaris]|uniref:FAD-dependent oxidoreductase n=1 Tax=Sneathiella limimaris TaxID=1964213 RepID=UPI0019CF91F6
MSRNIQLPQETEIVIIGGGVIGCSTAYHLTQLGFRDVHLLERRELTCGTTWHAAGLVGQLRATSNMTRLAQYTSDLYKDLESISGFATGFRQNGSIGVATTEARWEEMLRGADMARNLGLECIRFSPEAIKERCSLINIDDVVGGLFLPSDGQTNPIDTTRAMAAAARQNGAKIHEGVTVTSILKEDGKITSVQTDQGSIKARIVVLSGGMWSRELAASIGVTVPLHAAEHFYVVTEAMDGVDKTFSTLRDPDHNIYIKEDAGKLLIGSFEPVAKPWGHNGIPEDFSFDELPPDLDHFEPFLLNAMKRIPALEETGIHTWFNGPESFTPDDRYMLGQSPEIENLFIASGFNSIGIQSAGGAGKVLADWIKNGEPPMDLWDVDVRRMMPFQKNRAYLYDRTVETLGLLYEMHWPYRQPATSRNVRKSPLHDRLEKAGACFGVNAGWERPNWYTNEGQSASYEYSYGKQNWFENSKAEHLAVRETVGLFDQSSFAKYRVEGRDAEKLLNRLSTNDVSVEPGKLVYTQWLNDRGGIEADLTVTRLSKTEFMVFTSCGTQVRDLDWLKRHIQEDEHVVATDVTSAYSVLGLMGPNSRALLSKLSPDNFSNEAFPFATMQEIDLGYARVMASRITYVGELGWELYIPSEFTQNVYDCIVEAGPEFGLVHAGYHAMDSLRLEKAYRHWGHDITDEDTPLEAGLGFTVKWDKPGGFIGRKALLRQKKTGISKKLVQFKLKDPDAMLYHNEPIVRDGEYVGYISSGAYSHVYGASIGMGYVRGDNLDREKILSSTFELEIAGKRYPVEASLAPFYDPKSEKVKA